MAVQTQGITDLLMAPEKLKDRILNISGTRNLSDNISDLKAQVAANNRGISLVKELIAEYSLDLVQAYMSFIQVGTRLDSNPKPSSSLSCCSSQCRIAMAASTICLSPAIDS